MGGRIPDEKIDAIREQTDITQVVSRHVELRRAGGNFVGLCPFHSEKTPSFNVNQERQTFHCFGCGVGGNVFTFLMRVEGLTFPEVVERLARERGIELPRRAENPAEARARSERERLLKATSAARNYFRERLAENRRARTYLAERGLSDETIEKFGIGYAEDDWESLANHLERAGVSASLASKAGLLIQRRGSGHYDRFRNRIIFPIENLSGNTVGFGGRALGGGKTAGDDAKYLNSPETPLYDKGRTLFGLLHAREAIRREQKVLVVEGYFDALLLSQAGIDNVVAPCGTALTADQVRVLRRFTEDLVIAFDNDEAGRRATERAMHLFLQEGVQGLGLLMPEGMDPDDFIRQEGVDALRDGIERAQPLLEAWVLRETDSIRSFAERSRRATAIGAVLKKIRSPIERHLYLKMAAERLGVDERLMRDTVKRDDRSPGSPVPPDEAAVSSGGQPSELEAGNQEAAEDPTLRKIARAEEELLGYLFRAPELIAEPEVADTLESFLSPVTISAARVALETKNLTPAILVDRAGDPEVGSLVSRLATREAPMDARPPLELFRAGAWQLARMRVEREIRKLSKEMHDREREGTLPTDLLKKKVLLTRELEKYKGMSPEPTTPRSS